MILSCGHRSKDDGVRITTKEYTRDHQRAIGYKCVCPFCFKMYEKENLLFYSDRDAMQWLSEI